MIESRFIEKLLNGREVEWKPLGEAVNIANNTRKPVKASLRIAGVNPYYGANNIQDYVEGYTHDGEYVLIAEDGSASLENYSVQWATGKFWANNHVHVIQGKKGLDNRFLFHYLRQMNFIPYLTGGERAKLTKARMVEIIIPIPPIDVQQEIVRILDAFTSLTAELTAELTSRQKQYQYFRDKLLNFDDISDRGGYETNPITKALWHNKKVVFKALGEVCYFRNGKGHEKNISENGQYIVINSKFISTNGKIVKRSAKQISPLFINDILIVMSDLPNGKALAKTFLVDKNNTYTLNQRIGGLSIKNKSEILPEFLNFFLNRTKQLTKYDNGIDQTNLRKEQILDVKVPIIPLKEQQRIVTILDKFETLTNSIVDGLPKEIELRRKQYEYYREQLLSFPQ